MSEHKERVNAFGKWTVHKTFCQHCADLKTLCAKGQTLRLIATTSDREYTQVVPPEPHPDEVIGALAHAQRWVEYLNSDPCFLNGQAELVCDTTEDYLYDYKVMKGTPRFVFLVNLKHLDQKAKECFLAVTVGPNYGQIKQGPKYYIVNVHRPAGTTSVLVEPTPEGAMKALVAC